MMDEKNTKPNNVICIREYRRRHRKAARNAPTPPVLSPGNEALNLPPPDQECNVSEVMAQEWLRKIGEIYMMMEERCIKLDAALAKAEKLINILEKKT